MTPRRRQPPLLEALGAVPRRDDADRVTHGPATSRAGAPDSPAPGPRLPVVVEARPAATPGMPERAPIAPGGRARNRSTVILFLIAALIGLFAVIWSFAFRMGLDEGRQSILAHTARDDAAVITGQSAPGAPAAELATEPPAGSKPATTPVRRPVTPAGGPPASAAPAGTAGMPAIVGPDSRKAGFNYLEVVEMTWRDAEPAVRFLQAHGVRATAFPTERGVDPAKLLPNNRVRVYVDQPFGSGEAFRASQVERNALVADVRRLGKRWQTEHRGASDFQEPFWRLQRGK